MPDSDVKQAKHLSLLLQRCCTKYRRIKKLKKKQQGKYFPKG